jgi:hypothetical protein
MDLAVAAQSWDIGKLLSKAAVLSGFVGVLVRALLVTRRNKQTPGQHTRALEWMLEAFYGGSAVPGGLFLICCAFEPDWISYLRDLGLPLAIAGMSTLYVAYKNIIAG